MRDVAYLEVNAVRHCKRQIACNGNLRSAFAARIECDRLSSHIARNVGLFFRPEPLPSESKIFPTFGCDAALLARHMKRRTRTAHRRTKQILRISGGLDDLTRGCILLVQFQIDAKIGRPELRHAKAAGYLRTVGTGCNKRVIAERLGLSKV